MTGKYFDSTKYAKSDKERPLKACRHRANPEFQPRYGYPAAMRAAEKYIELAEKHGLTPAELALAFSKSRWYNAAVIIGTHLHKVLTVVVGCVPDCYMLVCCRLDDGTPG